MLGTRELVISFLPCWALGLSASLLFRQLAAHEFQPPTPCHGAVRVAKNSYGSLQNLPAVGF